MPASMISAVIGDRLKVTGRSIAIVATGPMPGSTPISVPSRTPIRQYSRLIGVRATPKPSARLLKRLISMGLPSAHEVRPEREGQREPLHEHQHGEDDQNDGQDRHFPGLELVAAEGAHEDEHDKGKHEPKGLQQVAEEHER